MSEYGLPANLSSAFFTVMMRVAVQVLCVLTLVADVTSRNPWSRNKIIGIIVAIIFITRVQRVHRVVARGRMFIASNYIINTIIPFGELKYVERATTGARSLCLGFRSRTLFGKRIEIIPPLDDFDAIEKGLRLLAAENSKCSMIGVSELTPEKQ